MNGTQASLPGELQEAVDGRLRELERGAVVSRVWSRDHTVWKPDPTEISDRLGWLDLAESMRGSVDEVRGFVDEVAAAGIERLVLLGMGGSSLAPQLFARVAGAGPDRFTVLDSTHPRTVGDVADSLDPDKTMFIVASKSGGTIETLSHFRYFFDRIRDGSRFTAITDPGSPLEELAKKNRFRHIFINPPDIGGRYSALSLFGLVPAAWVGLDLSLLLDEAREMADACRGPALGNPGASLGAAMGEAALFGRDKMTLAGDRHVPNSFGDWTEQLIAESTGKEGRGVVPVVWGDVAVTHRFGEDRLFVTYGWNAPHGQPLVDLGQEFRLGAEIFRWEFATAVAGAVLGINPFDQPNVAEAKEATAEILKGETSEPPIDPLDAVLESIRPGDYISIQAYLNSDVATQSALHRIRLALRDRFDNAVTVGYGPRFLHSTGQLHKGGPNSAVCIQLVDEEPLPPVPIPEAPFGFDGLIQAQALGDLLSLQRRGRRVTKTTLRELASRV